MHTKSLLRALCALVLGILAMPSARAVSSHYLTTAATSTITVYSAGTATISGTLVQASADTGGMFWPCQIVITQGATQVASQSFTQANASNGGTPNSWTVSLNAGTYTVTWYNSSGTTGGPGAGWSTLDWIDISAPSKVGVPPTVPVTFNPSPLSFVYDGGSHFPGISASAQDGSTPSYNVTIGSPAVNVSTNALLLAATGTSNSGGAYTGSWDGQWTITPAAVSYALSPSSFIYDGASHAPTVSLAGSITDGTLQTSLSGTTSAVDVGTYTLTASAVDGNHTGSNSLTWTIVPAGQTVSVAPMSSTISIGQSVVFTASGAKNGYAWGGSASGGGQIQNVTFNSAGTYSVTVSSPAGGNYSASNLATATVTVGKLGQTITFAKPANQTYGSTLPISATATSGLPVSLAVASGPASLSSGTLSFSGTGDVTVTASQAGNATYNAAPNVSQTFTVNPKPVTFALNRTSFPYSGSAQGPTVVASDSAATFSTGGTLSATNAGGYTATATANGNYTGSDNGLSWSIAAAVPMINVAPGSTSIMAGQSVTFTATGGPNGYIWAGEASGSGSSKSVTFGSVGTYSVTVYSPAGGNYSASNIATATITVGKLDQTISFAKPANQTYGSTLPISATATSGLPVSLAVASGPASLSGGTLSFSGIGDVTVTASQAGNATYNAAPNVSQTFTVNPKPVTFALNRTSFPCSGAAQGPAVIASDPIATFTTGGTLAATNAGSYTATATANGNYSGSNNGLGWDITPGIQTVSLVPVFATTTSGTSIAYTASGGAGSGAWIWGGTAGPLGSAASTSVAPTVPGSYTVTVQRAGDANYSASNQALATLTVVNTPPESTLASSQATIPLGASVTLTAGASDLDANLSSLCVDVSSDNATWTSGAANWSGVTAWALVGASASGSITFTPTTSGTWYFRARSADSSGAVSGFVTASVSVTAPAPSTVKVVPKSPGVVVQDSANTKHAQVRVP